MTTRERIIQEAQKHGMVAVSREYLNSLTKRTLDAEVKYEREHKRAEEALLLLGSDLLRKLKGET